MSRRFAEAGLDALAKAGERIRVAAPKPKRVTQARARVMAAHKPRMRDMLTRAPTMVVHAAGAYETRRARTILWQRTVPLLLALAAMLVGDASDDRMFGGAGASQPGDGWTEMS